MPSPILVQSPRINATVQSHEPASPRHADPTRGRRWLVLGAILLLALFLRVYQLDVLPPGLHYDEAFNGTQARQVLRGVNRPIFFTQDFGEEPLHIYTEAVLFALMGESPWTIRLTSALFGVVFVAALYACVRAFFPEQAFAALVAAFIGATLYWSVNFSRIGIETNSLPMVLTLSSAALGFAYRRMTWRWIVAAGLLLGATVYTYLAARLWLPAVLLWFGSLIVLHRSTVMAHLPKWIVIGVIACLTIAPLAWFFVANPVAFAGRSGQVMTLESLETNVVRSALMFFTSGDMDPRDNLPGRPIFDLFLAFFFAIGFLLTLVRFRKPFYALLLIWFVAMALPSALTEFAPNMRRAIGAMPAAIVICAVGMEWARLKIKDWGREGNRRLGAGSWQLAVGSWQLEIRGWRLEVGDWRLGVDHITAGILIVGLLISAWWSGRGYFVDWASSPGLFYSFDAGILEMAQDLADRPRDEQIYVSPGLMDHPTVQWAMDGREFRSFDGRAVLVLANSERAASYGIITYEDPISADALKAQLDGPISAKPIYDTQGKPYATIISIPGAMWGKIAPARTVRVNVGNFAVLEGFDVAPSLWLAQRGGDLRLSLYWFAQAPTSENYTVFVQLVGPVNPLTGSTVWAQADAQPGKGTYPTRLWREGERVLDHYALKIPPEAIQGDYLIQVGMYLLESGERVPLYGASGSRLAKDAVTLASITMR